MNAAFALSFDLNGHSVFVFKRLGDLVKVGERSPAGLDGTGTGNAVTLARGREAVVHNLWIG